MIVKPAWRNDDSTYINSDVNDKDVVDIRFADLTGPIGATILLKPSMIIMVLGLEIGKLNIFFAYHNIIIIITSEIANQMHLPRILPSC